MSLRKQLLNLLFPPRCPFCNQPLHDAETGPCPDCQQAPFWTQGAQGVARGQNFVRCACAGWYRGGLRDSLRRFKFSGQKGYAATYGPILAQAVRTYLPGSYDVLTWVPVSPARRITPISMVKLGMGTEWIPIWSFRSGGRATPTL